MHAFITIIHETPHFNENLFNSFSYLAETDDYECITTTEEESLKRFKEWKKGLAKHKKETPVINNLLRELKGLRTSREKIQRFADYFGYDITEAGQLLERYNQDGFYDWYAIGGRWNNILQDRSGHLSNTINVNDFYKFFPEQITFPFGIVLEYSNEEYYLNIDKEDWDRELNNAIAYSQEQGVDLYITVIDIHF